MHRFKANRFAFFQTICIIARTALLAFLCAIVTVWATASWAQTANDRNESDRSDKLTGGHIEHAEFDPNEHDIRVSLNVPSFRLTLWQNGKEVKSYFVGVGMKDYPIYVGDRDATEIIWNPAWIPPPSDWVSERKGVRPGEVIKASDPRNPLGKLKIPLGDRYLIHQAAKATDIGNLVSHGCVRMLRSDLYDLAEKIITTRQTGVSSKRIQAAKRNSRMLVVPLQESVPVDINYDTLVVEDRVLHIYPDVYDRGTNTSSQLRAELASSHVDVSRLDEQTMRRMLSKVTRRAEFVVDVNSVEEGRALEDGRLRPIIGREKATGRKQKAARRKG